MKEEKRKVQLTGGSTFTISLPIKWAREAGLKPGDELYLLQRGDKSLLITPVKAKKEQMNCAELTLTEEEGFEGNFRYLIAHYLVGYDIVRLLSPKGFSAEERKRIKEEVRKRLIGMEVVGESAREIILKSFLKYEDFTLQDAIRSMAKIIISMHGDAIASLCKNDSNLADDIIERDNEIDRFYLLIVRQLKAAMSDPELAKKIGVDRQRESLGYRIIVKSMERIGDHVENIARNSTMIPKVEKEDMRSIENIGNSVRGLFIKTLDALSMMDIEKANEVIKDANSLTEESEAISEQLLREEQSVDKIHALSVLQSLGRIAKYCEDIAEVTINMGIRGAEE
ncbi:MAG: phosphate uptake regulator PhoU [Methanophagales archaeon]|nr:phosphate uptake regulator PhoU [Methanophagales archaeon]